MRKYCPKCNHTTNAPLNKFCPQDGTELLEYTGGLHPHYSNPYGRWKVTTEGDCEGRTIKDLGTHEGYIDEIARYLVGSSGGGYSLQFTKLPDKPLTDYTQAKQHKEVSITLDIKSGTWPTDMTPEARRTAIALMMKDRPVEVLEGQYYASVKLRFND